MSYHTSVFREVSCCMAGCATVSRTILSHHTILRSIGDVPLALQRLEAARQKGDTAPSKGVIACLERLVTAAMRYGPAAVVASYERVLPAMLTSLAALDGSADASDDVILGALLEQVQQALATPQGICSIASSHGFRQGVLVVAMCHCHVCCIFETCQMSWLAIPFLSGHCVKLQ